MGANDGGVNFDSRINQAKEDKADELLQGLFDQLLDTAKMGSAGINNAFGYKTSSIEYKELLKEGIISQKPLTDTKSLQKE